MMVNYVQPQMNYKPLLFSSTYTTTKQILCILVIEIYHTSETEVSVNLPWHDPLLHKHGHCSMADGDTHCSSTGSESVQPHAMGTCLSHFILYLNYCGLGIILPSLGLTVTITTSGSLVFITIWQHWIIK